jgi:hypothetical protein
MRPSIAFQPRKLKYPTQKSARFDISSVSRSDGSSSRAMLSKMRGMGLKMAGGGKPVREAKGWFHHPF